MHIHGNLMNSNLASLYSADAAEKAASAQRAADVRKKLLESTPNIDGELNPEEILIRQWSQENAHKRRGEEHPRAPKKDQIADEEAADKSTLPIADEEEQGDISTWA
jgi:hypothetical protein